MKIKIAILILAIVGIGMAASQQQGSSNPDLNNRISKLEAQVQALQQQVKKLEQKSTYKFLSVPESSIPGSQVPPGAKSYKFNGQNIWLVPLGPDAKS